MNENLIKINHCEVCDGEELFDVLNLGLHPMCDDLILIGNDRKYKEFPIEILYCKRCNTAHQKYQIPKQELFPITYHYRARFTADVLNGMKSLVDDCINHFGDFSNKKVIDIGCNDGSLLDFFKERGAITYGIEPTNAYKDALHKGHTIFNDFLSLEIVKKIVKEAKKIDFITFTNVFAHIEDLKGVISALKEMVSSSTVIVIENHYLGAILEKNQFDTFYHEHPRTYSYNSFLFIVDALGLNILNAEFPSRYGGNIRVIIGNKDVYPKFNYDDTAIKNKEAKFFDEFHKMSERIVSWKAAMKKNIEKQVTIYGKIKAKAFPGRAAILMKLLGLDENFISAVYEKPGSMKIGNYIPGTRIPIKSDEELFETLHEEKVILNLAWHISVEIEKYLRLNGFKGNLIDIL